MAYRSRVSFTRNVESHRFRFLPTFVESRRRHRGLRCLVLSVVYRSLGCLIFEIITLIPIYQAHHCVIKGDTHSKRGLMGVKVQNIESLLLKQKHFRSMVLRRLKEYIGAHQLGNKISPKILELLPRML